MDTSILLIDSDLGLLFWLGRILDHAGYQAFPARSVPDAVALLRELHLTVGVLILNCSLPEAEDLVPTLRRSYRFLKVICLNGDRHHRCISGTDAVCRKPAGDSANTRKRNGCGPSVVPCRTASTSTSHKLVITKRRSQMVRSSTVQRAGRRKQRRSRQPRSARAE